MSEIQWRHVVEIEPAFDKRDPDPNKNYGIGAAQVRFVLIGPDGAVQLLVGTNWYLPAQRADSEGWKPLNGRAHWNCYPRAWDLGYHSRVPRYEGQSQQSDACPYLNGDPCFYDGSSLNGEPVLERMIAEGHSALWEDLLKFYFRIFKSDAERTIGEAGFGEVLSAVMRALGVDTSAEPTSNAD
jgi:hypothetical protein